MPLRIVWSPGATKDMKALDRRIAGRVVATVIRYAETDHGDVKALRGEDGVKRLRVGDYRVRFESDGATLDVLGVRHRREVYR